MPRILTLTLFLCLFPSFANAGIIYSFGQSNYTVAAGGTVNVSVFLQQTGTDTILTDFGIISSGVNVFFNEPVIPSDPAEVLALGDITPSPAFDDSVLTDVFLNPGVSAGMIGAVDILTPAIKGNSILLGTFKFTAGSVAGEVTHLRATDFDSLFDETIADNGVVLDSIIQDGFATITVNGTAAVPEPASGLIVGAVLLGGLYRGIKGRRGRNRESKLSLGDV